MLQLSLRGIFAQSLGRKSVAIPTHFPYTMSLFTSVIAGLNGTDLTRHMPQLSKKSFNGLLRSLLPFLLSSFKVEENQFDISRATDSLVARI
jgi:hypothetical protein